MKEVCCICGEEIDEIGMYFLTGDGSVCEDCYVTKPEVL